MPLDEAAARAAAEQLAEALCRYRFDVAVARFDARMARGLPPTQLERVARRELEPLGAFVSTVGVQTWTKEEFVTAIVDCSFERGFASVQLSFDPQGQIVELFLRAHPGARAEAVTSSTSIWLAAPFMLAVPVGFALLFNSAWGASVASKSFVVGSLGWALALSLRAPVALAMRRFQPARAAVAVVASSGPLEESVRLAALATAGRSFGTAFSVGLGWAAIEVVFTLVNGIAAMRIARGDDARAAVVREEMAAMGMGAPLTPFIGILERASASAFHIGATLLLAKQPLFLIATIPAHSLMNMATIWLRARGMWAIQAVPALGGSAALLGGLAVFDRLG